MTITRNHFTPEQREYLIKSDREWLAVQPPLPSAEELARPLIHALGAIHDAFDGRADAMLYDLEAIDVEVHPFEAQARELVATVEEVAALMRTAIDGMLDQEFRSWRPLDMDDVLRAITQSPAVANSLNGRTVFDFPVA